MKVGLGVFLLLLSVVILYVDGSTASSMTHHLMKRGPRRYCGKELSGMLSLLCTYGYNKRSESNEMYSDEDSLYDFYRVSMMPAQEGGFERTTRNVIDECCKYPCSQNTLEQYCRKKPH